jgi:hypothetical protein
MSEVIKIKIEDRNYTCHRMNPIEGLDFGLKVAALIASEDMAAALLRPEAKEVIKTAIDQCYTPENQSLSDIATFNMHFIKYPGDLMLLGFKAVQGLASDFFPAQMITDLMGSVKLPKSKE